MKRIFFVLIFAILAVDAVAGFEESKKCQKCHPIIYDEFYGSSHRKSSVYTDPIHKAVWDKHPLKTQEKYTCAVCHTPADKELLKRLEEGKPALPQANEAQLEEGISCVSCHTIESIEIHEKANKNILSTKPKTLFSAREGQENEKNVQLKTTSSFFGMFSQKSGSPYHTIDYSNKGFYNGDMCMGCHSHKQNAHKFEVCTTTQAKDTNNTKGNCISCHMPSVKGTMNTIHKTDMHIYHGFTGASNSPKMLAQYVKIAFNQSNEGFEVSIKNEATHPLFLHPLRVAQLQVTVASKDQNIILEPITFKRVIGANKKQSMPWLADSIVTDTQIQNNENRKVLFDHKLQIGDTVEVKMGFYILSKVSSKKLGLDSDKELSKFILLKKETFTVE